MNTLPGKFFSMTWFTMTSMCVGTQLRDLLRTIDGPLKIIAATTILFLIYGILVGLVLHALLWIARRDDEKDKSITKKEMALKTSPEV